MKELKNKSLAHDMGVLTAAEMSGVQGGKAKFKITASLEW